MGRSAVHCYTFSNLATQAFNGHLISEPLGRFGSNGCNGQAGWAKENWVVEIDKKEVVMTSERAYRAVAVGRTGKGGYGHGLHLAYENLGNVEITAVADEVAQNVASLTDRFDRAFGEETADQITQAITNMEEFTATLRRLVDEQSDEFLGIADDVQNATSEIASVLETARGSLERIDALLASGDLDSILVNTKVITAELSGVSGDISAASQSLSGTLTLADSTFLSLNRISTRLENGDGSLGRLLSDTLLGGRIESLVEELNLLMEDLRANPSKYVRLSIF